MIQIKKYHADLIYLTWCIVLMTLGAMTLIIALMFWAFGGEFHLRINLDEGEAMCEIINQFLK